MRNISKEVANNSPSQISSYFFLLFSHVICNKSVISQEILVRKNSSRHNWVKATSK